MQVESFFADYVSDNGTDHDSLPEDVLAAIIRGQEGWTQGPDVADFDWQRPIEILGTSGERGDDFLSEVVFTDGASRDPDLVAEVICTPVEASGSDYETCCQYMSCDLVFYRESFWSEVGEYIDNDWSTNDWPDPTYISLSAVAVHEFGHALGLDHPDSLTADSVMVEGVPGEGGAWSEASQAEDIPAASYIYGRR